MDELQFYTIHVHKLVYTNKIYVYFPIKLCKNSYKIMPVITQL